jgi:hypothetical protein
MNTLNLNAYGVSEMNKQEMIETDGGIPIWIPIVLVVALVMAPTKTAGGTEVCNCCCCS